MCNSCRFKKCIQIGMSKSGESVVQLNACEILVFFVYHEHVQVAITPLCPPAYPTLFKLSVHAILNFVLLHLILVELVCHRLWMDALIIIIYSGDCLSFRCCHISLGFPYLTYVVPGLNNSYCPLPVILT